MRGIILALCLAALPASSMAEEVRSPRILIGPQTFICNTREEVVEAITTYPTPKPDGCGYTKQPLWAEVVPLDELTHGGYVYPLVRIEMPMQKAGSDEVTWFVQFGFWGKPVPIPASLDVPA